MQDEFRGFSFYRMTSRNLLFIVGILVPLLVYAAARTITSAGTWSNTGIWAGGLVGGAGDDVTMNNTLGTITVASNTTIKTLNMGNSNTLTVNSGVNFTIDNLTLNAVTTGNNIVFNIIGDLVINGNLVIQNNLTLNVTGSLTVNGNVSIQNNGALNVSGAIDVTGDLTANNGTDFAIDGSLNVGGTLTAGNNSISTGTGTITAGGCVGDVDVCSTVTPIKLLFFKANTGINNISLTWATYEEENFDYFAIERSHDGINFTEVAQQKGHGWSTSIINYSFEDNHPIQGRSYYRLKSVDFDGYTEYFTIVSVLYTGYSDIFSVYPNPVQGDAFNLTINQDPGEGGRLRIFSVQGAEVYSKALQKGQLQYNISDFRQKGLYVFKVDLANSSFQRKVVIH